MHKREFNNGELNMLIENSFSNNFSAGYVKAMARDLLEAYAIINEMREEIGQLALTYAGGGVEAVCNNILEQTKDYAE